jgi:phosphatidylglycerophosphate synthase
LIALPLGVGGAWGISSWLTGSFGSNLGSFRYSQEALVAIILIVREFLVTGLRVVALSKNIVIPAEMGGKLKTTAQITSILCLILVGSIFDNLPVDLYDIGLVFVWIALVLSVTSGVQYTISFWKKI